VRLENALTTLGIDHDMKIYPDASHGFLNDHDPADITLLVRAVFTMYGCRFDADAAQDARHRIAAFFDRHLRSADPT
jgi:carboxymethylenebutenolidase